MAKPRRFNPNDELHVQRLYRAVQWSLKQQEPFRRHGLLSNKQLAGQFYGENPDLPKVPVNLLELARTIYRLYLAGAPPKAHVTTDYRDMRAYAVNLELAMNDLIRQIKLAQTMWDVVGSALLSTGIVKFGVHAAETIGGSGEAPFVDSISLDHWVHDMSAKRWDQVQYMGNLFCKPADQIKDSREFDRRQSDKLVPVEDGGEYDNPSEQLHSIGLMSPATGEGRIYDVVECFDLYLPSERMLVTIDAQFALAKPLRVVELDDDVSEYGCFELLRFDEVEGNTMPLPPSALWMDMHLLANNLFNKLANQARNQRRIGVYKGAEGAKDAGSLNNTDDGGWCSISASGSTEEQMLGGIDPTNLAFLMQVKDIFSWRAGNLDALGGLGPQSGTLGQDEMLQQSASQRLSAMHGRVMQFLKVILCAMSHYEMTGSSKRTLQKSAPGMKSSVTVEWDRAHRRNVGDLAKYRIDVVPYSFSGSSPAMKLAGLSNIFQTFYVPLLPVMQAEGYSIDVMDLTHEISRLGNIPELENFITSNGIPITEMGDESGLPKPTQTQRSYERVNKTEATPQGRNDVLSRALLGMKSQRSEREKAGSMY